MPEGSCDAVIASFRQLEDLERVVEERCGKSFSKVRQKSNIPILTNSGTFALGSLATIIEPEL